MSKRQIDTLTSIIIILILSSLSYLIGGIGGYPAKLIITVITLGVAIGVGTLFLLLRLLKVLKHPGYFLYNYFGALNIALALFEIGVIVTQRSFYLLKLPLVNFVIGIVILYDTYKSRSIVTVTGDITT